MSVSNKKIWLKYAQQNCLFAVFVTYVMLLQRNTFVIATKNRILLWKTKAFGNVNCYIATKNFNYWNQIFCLKILIFFMIYIYKS